MAKFNLRKITNKRRFWSHLFHRLSCIVLPLFHIWHWDTDSNPFFTGKNGNLEALEILPLCENSHKFWKATYLVRENSLKIPLIFCGVAFSSPPKSARGGIWVLSVSMLFALCPQKKEEVTPLIPHRSAIQVQRILLCDLSYWTHACALKQAFSVAAQATSVRQSVRKSQGGCSGWHVKYWKKTAGLQPQTCTAASGGRSPSSYCLSVEVSVNRRERMRCNPSSRREDGRFNGLSLETPLVRLVGRIQWFFIQ